RLAARYVKTILVEGGSTVIWSFLRKGLADELKVFVSSRVLGGQAAPTLAGGQGITSLDAAPRLRLDRIERLGDGALLEYAVVRCESPSSSFVRNIFSATCGNPWGCGAQRRIFRGSASSCSRPATSRPSTARSGDNGRVGIGG